MSFFKRVLDTSILELRGNLKKVFDMKVNMRVLYKILEGEMGMKRLRTINIVKKHIIGALILGLLLSFAIDHISFAETNSVVFSDLSKNHWAYDAVYEMVDRGVINGHADGTFRPNDPVQVDQFLKMILMALSEEQADGTRWWSEEFLSRTDAFSRSIILKTDFDFKPGEKKWAEPYIEQGINMGIIRKYDRWGGDTTAPLSRKWVAYILLETIRAIEEEEELNYANLARAKIKDFRKVEDYEEVHAILQVYMKGLMRGYQDGTFGVDRIVTRAEAVVMLDRILDERKRDPYLPDLSPYPHAEVPTYHGETKMVVFGSEKMKGIYDTVLENRVKSKGFTHHSSGGVSMIYYKDEDQYQQELQRNSTVNGMFKSPHLEVNLLFITETDSYNLYVSTEQGEWARHKEALLPALKKIFAEDTDQFVTALERLVPLAKQGEMSNEEFNLNGRKVIFQNSKNRDFLYIYVRE